MRGENLEAGAGELEVRDVKRVGMTEPGAVEAGAVVIDRDGTVDDLLPAVVVDVGDRELVVALAGVDRVVGREEGPTTGERAAAPIPRDDVDLGVVAAAQDKRRALAVELGETRDEAVDAVAGVVAPIGDRAAPGQVRRGGELRAAEAVEHGQI